MKTKSTWWRDKNGLIRECWLVVGFVLFVALVVAGFGVAAEWYGRNTCERYQRLYPEWDYTYDFFGGCEPGQYTITVEVPR